jgi:hypothetical protein
VIEFSKGKRRIPLVEIVEKQLCVPSRGEIESAFRK